MFTKLIIKIHKWCFIYLRKKGYYQVQNITGTTITLADTIDIKTGDCLFLN